MALPYIIDDSYARLVSERRGKTTEDERSMDWSLRRIKTRPNHR